MACVLHRLEMGQQCHLRASPPWPQMHLLGSEPSRRLRNPISTLFLFTGKRQKPPLWIMKETARSYFQRGWRKGFWGNLGEQVRGSGGEAEPGETPPKEALCAQPTQGSEVRGSFYRVGALKVWAPDLLQCFTWELVRPPSTAQPWKAPRASHLPHPRGGEAATQTGSPQGLGPPKASQHSRSEPRASRGVG